MTEEVDIEQCATDLGKSELFHDLDQDQLRMTAQLCQLISLERGDFLFREKETADWFYILLDGQVRVSMRFKLARLERVEDEERTLSTISAENHPVLGETALVGQLKRSTSMCCVRDSKFYRVQAHDMLALMQIDPLIGFFVFKRLSERLYERLRGANTDIVKLSSALVFALE